MLVTLARLKVLLLGPVDGGAVCVPSVIRVSLPPLFLVSPVGPTCHELASCACSLWACGRLAL